jgi:hypothetical protein
VLPPNGCQGLLGGVHLPNFDLSGSPGIEVLRSVFNTWPEWVRVEEDGCIQRHWYVQFLLLWFGNTHAWIPVEDTSPMISYEGTWVWSDDDMYYTNYSQASSHGTNQVVCEEFLFVGGELMSPPQDATATFKFRGSAVYLYGAKRENHVRFEILQAARLSK